MKPAVYIKTGSIYNRLPLALRSTALAPPYGWGFFLFSFLEPTIRPSKIILLSLLEHFRLNLMLDLQQVVFLFHQLKLKVEALDFFPRIPDHFISPQFGHRLNIYSSQSPAPVSPALTDTLRGGLACAQNAARSLFDRA